MSSSPSPKSNFSTWLATRRGAWPGLLLAGCCAVLSELAQPVQAAVTEAWVHRYNNVVSNSVDQAFKVVSDAAGNIIVTGSTDDGNSQDILTIKYSGAGGSVLWQNRYHGPGNSDDQARAVAVDGSGNVVVTGFSQGDFYTAKYATADGALLWEKRYSYGQANAVAVDSGGNAVVTGFSGNGTNDDYYTAKYAAADGALLWEKRYSGPANWHGQADAAVAVDGGGNVVVFGSSFDSGGSYHYYTAKYSAADGTLLWDKHYNGPANFVGGADFWLGTRGLALGPNGMVVVTGSSGGDYATVVYRENLPPVSIAVVPAGVRLRFTGVPGRSYTFERAPAVTGLWTSINAQIATSSGLIEYLDASAPPRQAFYRAAQP